MKTYINFKLFLNVTATKESFGNHILNTQIVKEFEVLFVTDLGIVSFSNKIIHFYKIHAGISTGRPHTEHHFDISVGVYLETVVNILGDIYGTSFTLNSVKEKL